jgi:hypothetical protein
MWLYQLDSVAFDEASEELTGLTETIFLKRSLQEPTACITAMLASIFISSIAYVKY